jgi:hypothetical protein
MMGCSNMLARSKFLIVSLAGTALTLLTVPDDEHEPSGT